VDGWCARKFNQVSTFGAVLDMVTDRVSTACLLVILSQIYRCQCSLLLYTDISVSWTYLVFYVIFV
jgi:CDP-diacylglycerol--inositol 3-phosphatidyltransferase